MQLVHNMTFVEEPTRYAGIKVELPADMLLYKGQKATLSGDVARGSNGDRVLRISEITNILAGVAAAYVDDGTGKNDGTGVAPGIRVLLPQISGYDLGTAIVGDCVALTGIASHTAGSGRIIPVILLRSDMDACNYTLQGL